VLIQAAFQLNQQHIPQQHQQGYGGAAQPGSRCALDAVALDSGLDGLRVAFG
jgi:hypothetical protein